MTVTTANITTSATNIARRRLAAVFAAIVTVSALMGIMPTESNAITVSVRSSVLASGYSKEGSRIGVGVPVFGFDCVTFSSWDEAFFATAASAQMHYVLSNITAVGTYAGATRPIKWERHASCNRIAAKTAPTTKPQS